MTVPNWSRTELRELSLRMNAEGMSAGIKLARIVKLLVYSGLADSEEQVLADFKKNGVRRDLSVLPGSAIIMGNRRLFVGGNWSFQEPPFRDGDVIESANCSQHTPETEVCKDVRDLKIIGGNFVNVKMQATWAIEGGNHCQLSRHVDEERAKAWGLPPCKADCEHRSAAKEWVEVDVDEFREAKASMSERDVKIEGEPDDDGVREQIFKKLVYTYHDKRAD